MLLRGNIFLSSLSNSLKLDLVNKKACYYRIKSFVPFIKHNNLHHFIKPHIFELLNFFMQRDLLLSPGQLKSLLENPVDLLQEEDNISSIYDKREPCL